MSFKKRLAEKTGIEEELLPSSYQIIGNVMLLKFMKIKSLTKKKAIASAILETFPYVETVCEIKRIDKEFRIPKVRRLAGNGTITIHTEHGMKYKLDASKIMFSKGNLYERQRLLSKIKKDETVIDMFAGIGYFSLSIAKKCKKVYAIEKNPIAYKYLKENIKLNKIKNIEPILGDNRKIRLNEKADRIVMGYFPGTEKFVPNALKMLKPNGIIHFHNTYREDEVWEKPMNDIKKNIKRFKILDKKVVKSVSPRTYHVVIDVKIIS